MSSPSKRRDTDIVKLCKAGHAVQFGADTSDFYVKFAGPKDSLYQGAWYKIHVTLPTNYPYKSPSIGFCTPIFHPNVDESSGSVCLDVINQTWSPMFDLRAVFEVFLPQLLLYPNPSDPLNRHAARLMNDDLEAYNKRVRDHAREHASKDFSMDDDDDDDEMSTNQSTTQSNGIEESTETEFESPASDDQSGNQWMMIDELDLDEEVLSDCDDFPTDSMKFITGNPADALVSDL